MNILIDITHPAKVHQFKHAAKILAERGHRVFIVARDKDVIVSLLRLYGFEFEVLSVAQKGFFKAALEVLERDLKIARLVKKHHIDVMLGPASSIPHVSRLTRAKSIIFATDDAHVVPTFTKFSYPFADVIATPACLSSRFGSKHVTYEGYHQLAYLHPNRYTPDPTVRTLLGVGTDEPYFILRFVALDAHHDGGQKGLSLEMRRQLVGELSQRGRVFITSEKELTDEFKPYQIQIPSHKMHDALYYAKMFVGDSQSMTMEAAVLGTPAVRCSTFVGHLTVVEEMEHKYGLTYGFLPRDEKKMLAKIFALLENRNLDAEWQARRATMLADKIDVTAWMVDFVENYAMRPLNVV